MKKMFYSFVLLNLVNFQLFGAHASDASPENVESKSNEILPIDFLEDQKSQFESQQQDTESSFISQEEIDHLFKSGANLILKNGDHEITISFGDGTERSENLDSAAKKIEIIEENKSILSKFFSKTANDKNVNYSFDKIKVNIPYKLYLIIEQLRKDKCYLNRMILHGPPGNGKTTLVKQISTEIKAGIIEVSGPTIVNKFQGSGAEKINEIFDAAIKVSKAVKIVIFIDEIDAIASIDNSHDAKDYTSAVQTLWLNLDKIKKNKNIYVVTATNKMESLHPTLVDRFGDNVFEISNPNAEIRKNIITYYNQITDYGPNSIKLDEQSITDLNLSSDGLSIRAVEDVTSSILNEINIREDRFEVKDVISQAVLRKKKAASSANMFERFGKFYSKYINSPVSIAHQVFGLLAYMHQLQRSK